MLTQIEREIVTNAKREAGCGFADYCEGGTAAQKLRACAASPGFGTDSDYTDEDRALFIRAAEILEVSEAVIISDGEVRYSVRGSEGMTAKEIARDFVQGYDLNGSEPHPIHVTVYVAGNEEFSGDIMPNQSGLATLEYVG